MLVVPPDEFEIIGDDGAKPSCWVN